MNGTAVPLREAIADKLDRMMIEIRVGTPDDWPVDMSIPQLRLLFVLHANGPLRVTDLSAALGVGLPTVTAMSTRLEERGFVVRERDQADKRVVVCGLTADGLEALDCFWRFRHDRMDEVTAGLSEAELGRVADVLDLLLRRMETIRDHRGHLPAPSHRQTAAGKTATA